MNDIIWWHKSQPSWRNQQASSEVILPVSEAVRGSAAGKCGLILRHFPRKISQSLQSFLHLLFRLCCWVKNINVVVNPKTPTVAIWVQLAIKHPVPDRIKPSFLFLTSGHSDAQGLASECPDVKNYKWRLNPIWHRMLYSCTHTAAVCVKGWIDYCSTDRRVRRLWCWRLVEVVRTWLRCCWKLELTWTLRMTTGLQRWCVPRNTAVSTWSRCSLHTLTVTPLYRTTSVLHLSFLYCPSPPAVYWLCGVQDPKTVLVALLYVYVSSFLASVV